MSYTVGRNKETKEWGWWESHHRFGTVYMDKRNATPEETKLMDKVVWGTATHEESQYLKKLINREKVT